MIKELSKEFFVFGLGEHQHEDYHFSTLMSSWD